MTDCKNCKYTDEYCASGDCNSQNTKNEQQKDLCITDDTLTEQFKKGELEKCKDYYVKYGDYEMSLTLDGDNDFIFYGRPIKPKVLAPVPSYDEWKAKLEENDNLKELLKECRLLFDTVFSPSVKYGELYKQIDEVLDDN